VELQREIDTTPAAVQVYRQPFERQLPTYVGSTLAAHEVCPGVHSELHRLCATIG
jgi:hypothetical protein